MSDWDNPDFIIETYKGVSIYHNPAGGLYWSYPGGGQPTLEQQHKIIDGTTPPPVTVTEIAKGLPPPITPPPTEYINPVYDSNKHKNWVKSYVGDPYSMDTALKMKDCPFKGTRFITDDPKFGTGCFPEEFFVKTDPETGAATGTTYFGGDTPPPDAVLVTKAVADAVNASSSETKKKIADMLAKNLMEKQNAGVTTPATPTGVTTPATGVTPTTDISSKITGVLNRGDGQQQLTGTGFDFSKITTKTIAVFGAIIAGIIILAALIFRGKK